MLKKIRTFLENTSGSIVPTMGILAIPLAITAGAAVDYTRYVNMRNDVQTAIDAAGIASVAELDNIQATAPDNLTGDAYNAYIQTELTEYADSFLQANITDPNAKNSYTFSATYIPATLASAESGIEIIANIEYDTIFGGISGSDGGVLLFRDKIEDQITSIINTANRTVEIALVMDNSGSMAFEAGNLTPTGMPAPVANRRITKLQTASKKLVDDIFKAAQNSQLTNPVQFSIVPFSSSVNIGKPDHKNHKNGNKFLDINGYASYHNENLDWANTYRTKPGETVTLANNNRSAKLTKADGTTKYLTRLDIFEMLGTEWEGCVEMRPYPHNVQDTYHRNNAAYNANKSEMLFVPYMVPDAPDNRYFNFYSNSGERIEYQNDSPPNGTSRYFSSNYIPDFYDYDPSSELAFPLFDSDDQFGNAINSDDIDQNQITRTNWVHKYQAYQGLDSNKINMIPNSPLKNEQLKDILNDLDVPQFEKNLGASNNSYFRDSGPNSYCPDIPVQQLSTNKTTVKNTIDSMEAHGGTNIQQGLTWGWRTLSEAKPFRGGRPLTDVNNRKILILLTDGNNQMIPESTKNNTSYTAWGYQRDENVLKHATTGLNSHGRLLAGANDTANTIYGTGGYSIDTTPDVQSEYEDLMNLHTNQACNNIKADGITIYTIAFDVPNGGKVKELLENCAGSGVINNVEVAKGLNFYHDVIGLALDKTFAEIASSISAIRIAK